MLYPEIKLIEKSSFCTCGNPNTRHEYEKSKPIYKIFELTIPTFPCGSKTFHLCEECLKIISEAVRNDGEIY